MIQDGNKIKIKIKESKAHTRTHTHTTTTTTAVVRNKQKTAKQENRKGPTNLTFSVVIIRRLRCKAVLAPKSPENCSYR